MAFLAFSIILASLPIANAAAAIKLTASVKASGTSITVSGTGFGANQPVGIAFGAEVKVVNEEIAESGPYDVGTGPYTYQLSKVPVKPGTYAKLANISSVLFVAVDIDNGNGTFSSPFAGALVNGTINYVTGYIATYLAEPIPSTTHYINLANYTTYEHDVTPAAGVFADPSGAFITSINVPSVGDGVYAVTAIDTKGNMATTTLTIANSGTDWDRTYGGMKNDTKALGGVVQTSDGGYAILANTTSFGAGGSDLYLIKTDADGDKIWSKTYGGALDDFGGDMCLTSDGGFAICGSRPFMADDRDIWLIKTNANGDIQWHNSYDVDSTDMGTNIIQTPDGGYAIAGFTTPLGSDYHDALLLKTDASGNMQWSKTYGGTGEDIVFNVVQASGGYALGGYTNSSGAGDNDYYLLKTDSNGNMQWNKTYGGTGIENAYSMIATLDGGYALGGYTTSFGLWKAYLVKTDANGNTQWEKTYSRSGVDIGVYVIQTADGGYAIGGWTYLSGGFTNQDFLLIKTDASGNLQWINTYGGQGLENCYSLIQANDGGYVLTGNTESFGLGGYDIWVVKTNAAGVVPEGITLGVMLLLSTIAVLVSMRYYRKRPKCSHW